MLMGFLAPPHFGGGAPSPAAVDLDSEPRDDVQKLSPHDIYGPYLFINTT